MRSWILVLALLPLAGCLSDSAPESTDPATTTMPPVGTGNGNVTLETVSGADFNFTALADATLRPGINMVHSGASCTTSFLFTENWEHFYLATAAHCVAPDDLSSDCSYGEALPELNSTLVLTDGTEVTATVAYHSWTTMVAAGETDADTCRYNDFALLHIDTADWGLMHPASLHFEAPTNLSIEPPAPQDSIWGYGASILKQGVEPTHPKQGTYLNTVGGGWSHHVYLGTPGIPGDSGGHIMTADGKALGVASTITIAPLTGSNNYTDFAMALAYMSEHAGWAPELVTWDSFNASLA